MNQKLFSEINPLYISGKDHPNVFRLRIQMYDPIDGEVFTRAVGTTMNRYPYFCVELKKVDGEYVLVPNPRPVVAQNTADCVPLNSAASNYHMIAFTWADDWMFIECSHALTDGTGIYEVLRTLLYYYCSERYHVHLNRDGIRLAGDDISYEEWKDPALKVPDIPQAPGKPIAPCLNLMENRDRIRTVYAFSVEESELMQFVHVNDGSPATIVALFLSRAIESVHPNAENPIRISLCVNQRKALHAPLAHQSLVGGAWLEYTRKMRGWSLDRQATAYRGMVFVQSMDGHVLSGVAAINRNTRKLLSMKTDRERVIAAEENGDSLRKLLSATVSYVGQAKIGGAEKYIRDFHFWGIAMFEGILVEISAVNGRFTFDISQNFSDPVYVDAFQKQLEENGIRFERQPPMRLLLPELKLPWEAD